MDDTTQLMPRDEWLALVTEIKALRNDVDTRDAELDRLRAENERLREALAQICLAVKDVKNGNVTLGEFIDCATAILTGTEKERNDDAELPTAADVRGILE